eukprot:g21403.t1
MSSSIESIRNIGIIAHIDAGKTTTTERILYYTGVLHRPGGVDEGTTKTDFDKEEAERGITIYSAAITCRWNSVTINIIDTPGHVDFTAEVERSLRVLDGAVVIFSAVEGVEAQSETVWRQADKYGVPRICFINKMDRIGADFSRVFDQIQNRLSARPVALQIPIGAGAPTDPNGVRGVIDLIEMRALYFDAKSKGQKVTVDEIPEDFAVEAELRRQEMIEVLAEYDDEVMMAVLEEQSIPNDKIHSILRTATLQGHIQPTFCGASLDYIGVQPVLDAVERYLPSPLDRPPVEGEVPVPGKKRSRKKSTEVTTGTRKPESDEPFCGIVFKIHTDKHADLCFYRIYSGTLKSGSRVLNPRTEKKELVSQIWRLMADSREKVDSATVGDIVGLIGPKDVVTGDTLCDIKHPILLESIVFPETVISMAVEPDSSAERDKLADTLTSLAKQDPTFTARVSEDTGQTIISGMGELHLEVLRNRMQNDFGLKVRVHKPRVSYRETIRNTVTEDGVFERKTGDVAQYAKIRLKVEPFIGEDSLTLENELPPGTLSNEFEALLQDAVLDEAQGGGVVGYPLMNVKLTIVSAETREGETTDIAIQAAAKAAVRNCLDAAGVVLLEPIMKLEVVTPEESLGNIQADLNARRAAIVSSERNGDLCVLEAHASLAQMFGYSTQVRSLSQGRASYSMEPLKYDEAPPEVFRFREIVGQIVQLPGRFLTPPWIADQLPAFYNGPAWKAGVKSGDLILAIDGKDTRTMSLADVVKLLRGGDGTVVEMKVRQPDAQDIRTLKITRGVAFIPTVAGYRQISAGKWQFRVEKSQGLAYIRINSIGSSTLHELRQVERQLRGKGVRGILLDLRYGGGTLHDIVMVADALLDGKVIGRVQTGQSVKTHKSRPGALFAGLPLAVLLDRTASSGREFLAAALQDGRAAVVVGEPTSGDGVVRRAIPIPGWNHSMVIAVGTLQRGDGTPLRAVAAPPATVRLRKKTPAVKRPRHRAGGVIGTDANPSLHKAATISLPFEPRHMCFAEGRKRLLVAGSFAGMLAVIDSSALRLVAVRQLQGHNIRGLTLSSDGKGLLTAQQMLNPIARSTFDDVHWGNMVSNVMYSFAMNDVLSSADVDLRRNRQEIHLGEPDHAAGDPGAIALGGNLIAVALSGVGEVTFGHSPDALNARVAVGRRPVALVISADGKRLYSADMFSDTVSVVDTKAARRIAVIPLGRQTQRSLIQQGEELFFDARLSHNGWMSCHSCHTDGHTNGKLNDNLSDGSFGAAKRVLSLLGVADTGPWAWSGAVKSLEQQVRTSITKTMQGKPPRDGRVAALVAYMTTLKPAPAAAHFETGPKTAEFALGKKLFAKLDCRRCHTPPAYTSPRAYDVGLRDGTGSTKFNPPSLRGVGRRTNFFHDGRAGSLHDVFDRHRHQLPRALSRKERDALIEFLRSL